MNNIKEFLEHQKKRRRQTALDNLLFVFLLFILVGLMMLSWNTVYYFIYKYG